MIDELFLFLHVFAAVIVAGGMHYVVTALGPLAQKGGDTEKEFTTKVLRKFKKLALIGAILLFVTGGHLAANTGHFKGYADTTLLVILKVTLALVLIAVGIIANSAPNTAEGGKGTVKMMRLGLVLAVVVIALGTYLTTHRPDAPAEENTATEETAD